MNNLVLEAINRFSLLDQSKNVIVALSGGADSVSLLYCLLSLKERLGITLSAAHLNHCLRGDESERDQHFVEELCGRLGVPLYLERVEVKALAETAGDSIELAARKARYNFFESIAKGSVIATAHTADDSLETVIFNLSRGTALKGLCGIPPKRDIFIRPLILCTREMVEEYCAQNSISFVTDSTNLTDEYTRNKIRHNVVPVLREINHSVANSVVRNGIVLSEEDRFLADLAKEAAGGIFDGEKIEIVKLLELPKVVAKRALKQIFEQKFNASLENGHIEQLYLAVKENGKCSLPLDLLGVCKDGFLYFESYKNIEATNYKTEFLKIPSENVNKQLSKNLIDCDKIIGELNLRTRKDGDKIRQADRGVTKSLKKLFTENKVPLRDRENLPVIADEKGVIWVYGIGVAERVKVDKNSKNILLVKSEIIK